jgi:hypothetical protein
MHDGEVAQSTNGSGLEAILRRLAQKVLVVQASETGVS